MRNLRQYPITAEEKLEALDWAIEQAMADMGESVGDIRPAVLQEVRKDIQRGIVLSAQN